MESKDLELYRKQGFNISESLYTRQEVNILNAETHRLMHESSAGKVLEGNGKTLRSINGPNLNSELFQNLACDARLLGQAEMLLGGPVYVHQYKINTKQAFQGQNWEWHSDYWFWKKEDGMPEPKALTTVIFLDEVNEFNGPMLLVPGTQYDVLIDEIHDRPYGELDGGDNWAITTAQNLKYRLSETYLRKKIENKGIVAAKGRPGDVLFFHCNLLHCSSANSSPWDRKAVFISYNLVSNCLNEVPSPRPEFMASRQFTPLTQKRVF
ncbi:phytanoyl-CoA dioxygenase family protein [Sodalis ligni]|uniref:phytanoyl-CoA dioxygenase family protein n=1 Tax=Sodalis ligni TaxID=2697027 RepID=UPI00193F53B0|nr:phytanoyl-CoA dioxygenase family protein [Sodalis ligni]QWA10816.1 phytanoyl-CoA dioxygenase family protein [Sodalis ligni]